MTLPLTSCDQLYRYIARVVQNSQSTLYAINGIENHIHLLVNLHPSVRLSDLVRDIKLSTSQWIKQNRDSFPQFAITQGLKTDLSRGILRIFSADSGKNLHYCNI